jgi:DNA-binding NtrC family response regulator
MSYPTVLLVDDNRDLLRFLERLMAGAGWTLLTAESATEAKRLVAKHRFNAALVDYMLPDGNGVELGVEFLHAVPDALIIVMTGTTLPPEEEALCEEHNFPVLRKRFLASDVISQIQRRMATPPAAEGATSESAFQVESIQGRALKVFVSYSHRDEIWRKRLDTHLSTLKRMGIIHS